MKLDVYIATSMNGYISNSRNVPDWLSTEYEQGFEEICQNTKAVIMGKTTYDILAPDYLPLKDEGATIVLTRGTDDEPANPTVRFTSQKPEDIVASLEEAGFSEAVIVGGAAAISEFINAGLVSSIIQVVEPVLFKAGLPLLKNVELDHKLLLMNLTKLNDHTVRLHYRIAKEDG